MRQEAAAFAQALGELIDGAVARRMGYVTAVAEGFDNQNGRTWSFFVGPKDVDTQIGARTLYRHEKFFSERSGATGGANTVYPELLPFEFDIHAYRDFAYEQILHDVREELSAARSRICASCSSS